MHPPEPRFLYDRLTYWAQHKSDDHPAVLDAAVFGIPDDKWGESAKAVVELSSGGQPSEPDLVAWCRERRAHYMCPRSVEITPALPRNPTGKLVKRDLRTPYWETRDRAI